MRERPPLEAVVFDAGGTLVRIDFEWMADAVRALGVAVEASAIRRGEVEGRRRYDASRGRAPRPGDPPQPLGAVGDTRAYFGGMLEAAGVPADLVERALDVFADRQDEVGLWVRPMEGARAALDALARTGVRRAVVSNSDGRAAQHLRDTDMLRGIEFVIDSHEVGVEKPDPAIFRFALERLGVAADRALYVGDIRSVDEVGARAAGMHFVLIDPLGDYAAPDTSAIRGMDELADWVAGRFELRPAQPDAAVS